MVSGLSLWRSSKMGVETAVSTALYIFTLLSPKNIYHANNLAVANPPVHSQRFHSRSLSLSLMRRKKTNCLVLGSTTSGLPVPINKPSSPFPAPPPPSANIYHTIHTRYTRATRYWYHTTCCSVTQFCGKICFLKCVCTVVTCYDTAAVL